MLTRAISTLPEETERIAARCIACAIEVHRQLGPGFMEGIYHDAMVIELEESGLEVVRERPITVMYRQRPLRRHRIDMVVGERVLLELKAVQRLEDLHQAQLLSYLKASGVRIGLLMNFNTEVLRAGLRRVVR
jgi:GxxExxY protein